MGTPLKRHINNFNEHRKYLLETNLDDSDKPLYRLFKKRGNIFVEIDSFNGYEDANEEARALIKELTALSYLVPDQATTNSQEVTA